jgi:hypothetical protein
MPEPGLLGGFLPMGYGGIAMLTDYISPEQHAVACRKQDTVYGPRYMSLDKEPFVFQVPEFGDRFWVVPLYDARRRDLRDRQAIRNQTWLLWGHG